MSRTRQEFSAPPDPVDGHAGRGTDAPDAPPRGAPEFRTLADTDPSLDLPWLAGWRADGSGVASREGASPRSNQRRDASLARRRTTISETSVSGDLALNRPGDQYRALADLERVRRVAAAKMWDLSGRLAKFATVELAWRARTLDAKKLGPRLERLSRSGWRVLHSLPLGAGASMVDHLIIGPGGVFTLSTHEHREERVWVSGPELRANAIPVPYLSDAIASAQRVARLLTSASGVRTQVMPCIIVVTGTAAPSIVYHTRPEGALILDSSTAIRVIRGLSGVLTPKTVERIYEAARRRATWEVAGA